jgi:DNA-directed RNA polymerase subunit M/transcription elongation factor TFIIS
VNRELVRKTNYLLSAKQIRRLIDAGHIACPKCGGKKLVWACCQIDVADPSLLEKLAREVKKG